MTKMQFKQNTSEKLEYCTGIVASNGNKSFSKLNKKVGPNGKTWQQFRQAPHEEKSVRFKKGFTVSAIVNLKPCSNAANQ